MLDASAESEADYDDDYDEFDPFEFIKNLPVNESKRKLTCVLPKKTRGSPAVSLVLDLDETLVHASLEHMDNAQLTVTTPPLPVSLIRPAQRWSMPNSTHNRICAYGMRTRASTFISVHQTQLDLYGLKRYLSFQGRLSLLMLLLACILFLTTWHTLTSATLTAVVSRHPQVGCA